MIAHLLHLSNRHMLAATLVGVVVVAGVERPVVAQAATSSFIDATAKIVNPRQVHVGASVYVAPFALLKAGKDEDNTIHIGSETNIQDNVTVRARRGAVTLGERVILAHGSAVNGDTEVGEHGRCPGLAAHCPSFVGFNSLVDQGNVEKDAMVLHLARVGSGVTIPSGCKVLSGKNITDQTQVGTPPACNPPFTAPVTDADRAFMAGVIEVNVCFAEKYAELAAASPDNVRGINFDPDCQFNPGHQLPIINGVFTRNPEFRNRIIGDVRMHDNLRRLKEVMGDKISLRADEGFSLEVGSIRRMGDRTTFHALEHTHQHLGNEGRYGRHSLMHGGPADIDPTKTGDSFKLGQAAVFFRSQAGVRVSVGCRSLVQQSKLADGAKLADFTVMVGNEVVGKVEWGTCPNRDDDDSDSRRDGDDSDD